MHQLDYQYSSADMITSISENGGSSSRLTTYTNDAHLAEYRKHPLLHRDPFDRLQVAQARVEELILLACDEEIARYEVGVVWA